MTNDERQVADLLRQFRLEPEVAGSRMPWATEWPLDRLMVTAADLLEASPPAPSGWQLPQGPSIAELRDALRARVGNIERASDGGNKGWQCIGCGEWDKQHHDHCDVVFFGDLIAVLESLPSEARQNAKDALSDPITAAVDAQLDPLKDELIKAGHKLAKDGGA